MKTDFYDILGVDKEFTPEQLKKAYRDLCKEHHPDQGGDREEFETIKKAFDTLRDPEKRQRYDLYGETDEELEIIINCSVSIFKKAIEIDTLNIEKNIKTIWQDLIVAADDNIKSLEKDILKNEGIIKKIIHAPSNDFIGNVLKHEIKQNQQSIKSLKKAIDDMNTAYEMLSTYMFDCSSENNSVLCDSWNFESYRPGGLIL